MNLFPIVQLLYSNVHETKDKSVETIHEIKTRLKFISTIKKDEKINSRFLYIQPRNFFTVISRMFNRESRDNTLNFLTHTYDRAFSIIKVYTNDNIQLNINFCKDLMKDIISSLNGLKNIQDTYSCDRLFVCQIQTLYELIEIQLKDFEQNKPQLFNSKIDTLNKSGIDKPVLNKSDTLNKSDIDKPVLNKDKPLQEIHTLNKSKLLSIRPLPDKKEYKYRLDDN